jgi:hypothetical protein
MQVSDQLHVPVALPPGRAPGTHWIGDWVGLKAGLDAVEKRKISCACQESNPNYLAVQPVASHYTN